MPDGVTTEWIANLVARVQEATNARFFNNYPNNYQNLRYAAAPTGGLNPSMPGFGSGSMPSFGSGSMSGFGSGDFTSPNFYSTPHASNGPSLPNQPTSTYGGHDQTMPSGSDTDSLAWQPTSTYNYGPTIPSEFDTGSAMSSLFNEMSNSHATLPCATLPWAPAPAPPGSGIDSATSSSTTKPSFPPVTSLKAVIDLNKGNPGSPPDHSGGNKPVTRNKKPKTATRTADAPSASPSASPSVIPPVPLSFKGAYSSGVKLMQSTADDLLGAVRTDSCFVCPL